MSEVENKRTPRPLKGTDIYLMTSIIGKIGVKNLTSAYRKNYPVAKSSKKHPGQQS